VERINSDQADENKIAGMAPAMSIRKTRKPIDNIHFSTLLPKSQLTYNHNDTSISLASIFHVRELKNQSGKKIGNLSTNLIPFAEHH
jgi:hypothetical protein